MDQDAVDAIKKLTVVLTGHRAALDRFSGLIEKNNQALDVAVSLPLKFDLLIEVAKKHSAAMSKMTAVLADLEPHLERQAKRLAENGLMPVGDPLARKVGKRLPDRADRANLEFAERYGPAEEVDRLHSIFDFSTKGA